MSEHDSKASIFCPRCAIPTQVIDSRGAPENEVRRRRRCSDCGLRFSTYEKIAEKPSSRRSTRARTLIGELTDLLGIGRKYIKD